MNSPKIVLRINAANPDHHLWNNNGTWWCHYTVHPTPLTKQRIRASLGTKDLGKARLRRYRLLFVASVLIIKFKQNHYVMIHQQGSVREWLGKFTLAKPTHDEIEAAKKWAAFAESKYSDKWV